MSLQVLAGSNLIPQDIDAWKALWRVQASDLSASEAWSDVMSPEETEVSRTVPDDCRLSVKFYGRKDGVWSEFYSEVRTTLGENMPADPPAPGNPYINTGGA